MARHSVVAFICPTCKCLVRGKTLDSRASPGGIRRRRQCGKCKKNFTTYEYIGDHRQRTPQVVQQLAMSLLALNGKCASILEHLHQEDCVDDAILVREAT